MGLEWYQILHWYCIYVTLSVIVIHVHLCSIATRKSVALSSGCSCDTASHRRAVINYLCCTTVITCLCVGDRGAAAGQHRWWHHSVVLFWHRWPPDHPFECCWELHVKVATPNPNVGTLLQYVQVYKCHFWMLHVCVQGRVSPASLWLGSVSPWSWNRCECTAIPAQGLAGFPEQTDPKHHAGACG